MSRTLKGAVVLSAVLSLSVALAIKAELTGAAFQKSRTVSSSQRTKKVDELFKRNCARCHGPDGTGETPLGHLYKVPDFTDSEWWETQNPSKRTLVSTVARGKGDMPAFGKKLTKAEIGLLVDRVRSFRARSVAGPP